MRYGTAGSVHAAREVVKTGPKEKKLSNEVLDTSPPSVGWGWPHYGQGQSEDREDADCQRAT